MKKTNNNLLLGISLAITIFSLAGFLMMSAAYYEKSKALNEALKPKQDNQASNERMETISPADLKIAETDYFRGDKDAPITVIEFSDFQCPYCSRFHSTMQEIVAKNKNVKWVFKHFALPSHPFARKSALAAECAGEQGKFWEYADELYANQGQIGDEYFGQLADSLKLDASEFNQCLTSEKYAQKVDDDQKLGQSAGVSATPTSFANGREIMGALSYSEVLEIINN